jgi:hypothetical protein
MPSSAPTLPTPAAEDGTSGSSVGRRLIAATMTWDAPALRALLADDVWLRALLVRDVVEHRGVEAAMRALHGWFGSADETELLHASSEPVTNRERITYRARLRPSWEPRTWHVIEQTGYLRVVDGRITRIDLTCTGFHPTA